MTQDLTLGVKGLNVRKPHCATQDLTLEVKGLKVRSTMYDARFDSDSEKLNVRTTLYDLKFDSGSERVQKLEPHCMTPGLTLEVKGLNLVSYCTTQRFQKLEPH